MARAVSALLEARDCLLEAERARGKGDATADAGRLADAILGFGGALPNEQEPWSIKHALDRTPGVADPDGAGALEKLTALVASAMRLGARRRTLRLGPQPGLICFANVAIKHSSQRDAVNELVQLRREEESARQRTNVARLQAPRSRASVAATQGARPPDDDDEDDDGNGDDSPRVG